MASAAGRSTIRICPCRRCGVSPQPARSRRDAAGRSDRDVGEPHVDGHRRAAGAARRHLQRPADPRAGVPPRVEPWRDKSELVHARTLYDAAHERGLTTAQVDWVAIQNAPTITWEFPERPDPKGQSRRRWSRPASCRRPTSRRSTRRTSCGAITSGPGGGAHPPAASPEPAAVPPAQPGLDAAPLRTAHAGGDGRDGAPRLAGCDHPEALEKTGFWPRTTVFVVSDHGFKAVKRQIRPNVVFAKAGLITVEGGKVAGARSTRFLKAARRSST